MDRQINIKKANRQTGLEKTGGQTTGNGPTVRKIDRQTDRQAGKSLTNRWKDRLEMKKQMDT